MRGKLLDACVADVDHRIIPAHAGQTDIDEANARRKLRDGSSPRMRGKPFLRPADRVADRIIPAHAGQTSNPRRKSWKPTDHPRACGANGTRRRPIGTASGSSPRMRGKPRLRLRRLSMGRIIPAHAGQTRKACGCPCTATDHPRACGANSIVTPNLLLPVGSSPRMRGKHGGRHDRDLPARIIPAHAGQTAVMPPDVFRNPDHPRACGANDSDRGGGVRCRGSSPRMRGKQIVIGERVLNIRIIPAHAGQT